MFSAFGVDHGALISKTAKADRRIPEWASSAVPGSTINAYNNSSKHKGQAAASNLGAKAAGSATGSILGATGVALAARKFKGLKAPVKLGRIIISGDRKLGAAQAVGAGAVGGVVGGVAGARSLNRIRGDKKYKYRER